MNEKEIKHQETIIKIVNECQDLGGFEYKNGYLGSYITWDSLKRSINPILLNNKSTMMIKTDSIDNNVNYISLIILTPYGREESKMMLNLKDYKDENKSDSNKKETMLSYAMNYGAIISYFTRYLTIKFFGLPIQDSTEDNNSSSSYSNKKPVSYGSKESPIEEGDFKKIHPPNMNYDDVNLEDLVLPTKYYDNNNNVIEKMGKEYLQFMKDKGYKLKYKKEKEDIPF